jgi:hypothetical protein
LRAVLTDDLEAGDLFKSGEDGFVGDRRFSGGRPAYKLGVHLSIETDRAIVAREG